MKFVIDQVFTPSTKQTAVGILGTTNINIEDDDGVVVIELKGITVRASKSSGEKFLSEPSFPVGEGTERKWRNHYRLFPLIRDDDTMTAAQKVRKAELTDQVLRILDAGGTPRRDYNGSNQTTPVAQATTKNPQPW